SSDLARGAFIVGAGRYDHGKNQKETKIGTRARQESAHRSLLDFLLKEGRRCVRRGCLSSTERMRTMQQFYGKRRPWTVGRTDWQSVLQSLPGLQHKPEGQAKALRLRFRLSCTAI